MINQEQLVSTFLELVRIDSPSGNEDEIARYVAQELRALGAETRIDDLYNVVARLPGRGAAAAAKPLFLSAHTDNVTPARGIKPVVSGERIVTDGTTVLGADDLAGVAAILEGLRALEQDEMPHVPLEIAITSQEEVGLVGAKGLDVSALKAKEGFVFDGHGPVGAITLAAPTHNLIEMTFTGRAAHSAVAPEAGINAIQAAAHAITRMKLGRVDRETTTNIGIIRGGTARNIVPEKVELVAEARSRNSRKLERATRALKVAAEKAARDHHAGLDFRVTRAYNHYQLGRSDRVVQRAVKALRRIGRKPRFETTMGGSDANIWNAKGIRSVVVSVGYEQMHTTDEYIPLEELVQAAELVLALAAP